MTTKKDSSVAASNLRKIWDSKKSEIGITQTEAAQKLGWTQGALAQYLNNITDLNPPAVIKLANFFGIDCREIDPAATGTDYPCYVSFPTTQEGISITIDLNDQYIASKDNNGMITLIPKK